MNVRNNYFMVLIIWQVFCSSFFAQERVEGKKKNDLLRRDGSPQLSDTEQNRRVGVVPKRNFSPVLPTLSRKQKKSLQPSAEVKERFREILRNSKTGIFKIFPDYECEEQNVLRVDDECANFIPTSAFYSLRKKQHTTDVYADLRLTAGFLVSDGFLTQSILVNLGDISLQSVLLSDESLKPVRDFTPETAGRSAKKQRDKLDEGFVINGLRYSSAARAVEGNTYVLRVVAYRGYIPRTFRGFSYNVLGIDKRKDLTVALHVARIDENGSVTIVWRELERKDAPVIVFN